MSIGGRDRYGGGGKGRMGGRVRECRSTLVNELGGEGGGGVVNIYVYV